MHPEAFDFGEVGAVVMDEFHSFNDRERGIVWEFSLALLPKNVRTLLLSATVGNSLEFVGWLKRNFDRRLDLVEGDQRKVPLTFQWVPDRLLGEQIEQMAQGDEASRLTPALVFCFNREQCWTVAEQLKGKSVLGEGQQARLVAKLREYDWSRGAGPKLRQLLLRGVGVHHAGVLPKYRRIVEDLFQEKLLSVAICTETLSAGTGLNCMTSCARAGACDSNSQETGASPSPAAGPEGPTIVPSENMVPHTAATTSIAESRRMVIPLPPPP